MHDLASPPDTERRRVPEAGPFPRPQHHFTVDEYLAFERTSDSRHEYYAGNIYVMVGGTEPHNLIAGNAFYCLKSQLRSRPCKVYTSDMRLKIAPTGLYTYPDVMALCGEVKLADDCRDMIENPQIVVEVLSPSTEAYDRGTKLDHYKRLESVTDCILISQDARRVEHHARGTDGRWRKTNVTGSGIIRLASLGCEIPLDEIYDQIELPA